MNVLQTADLTQKREYYENKNFKKIITTYKMAKEIVTFKETKAKKHKFH